MHIVANLSINSFYGISVLGKSVSLANIFVATSINAYSGQLENQSRVQQSTIAGNFLHLILKASPTGLIHKTICN